MSFRPLRVLTLTALLAGTALPVLADGVSGAYLAARQARYDNDFEAAAQYYTKALTRDPSNPAIMESAVLSQMSLGRFDRALPVARKIASDGLRSQVAQMVLMADEAASGEFDNLLTRISDEAGVGPLVDGLVTAWAHMGKGAMSDALEAFDVVAEERGLRAFALYHKALALASVGDFESAEAIFDGEASGPMQMTRRGAMARAEILSQLERSGDAVVMIDAVFGSELDPGLRLMRAELAAGKTLPFTHVTSARDGIAEVFYSVAGALSSEAGDEYTLLYSRTSEALRPDHIDAVLLSAQLLERLKRYGLATETYKKVPRSDPSFHAAELGRAEALRRSGKTDAAAEVLQSLSETHGDFAIVHSTRGDLMRQLARYEDAVEAYDAALSLSQKTENAQWFTYYARGISHERLGQWDRAEADFRQALELNPDQPQVLNYLGYSLVEKQVKLDEALEMIERAVAARPDSGYIIDSLGWVLYRLGRYDEAVGHMERATELMPIDPVVNDHLGDVYWAVGRTLEAEFQWKRALSFVDDESASEGADPDRIRRKLEVGLDQVLAEEGNAPLKVANDD